jgi:hypothetical protein
MLSGTSSLKVGVRIDEREDGLWSSWKASDAMFESEVL